MVLIVRCCISGWSCGSPLGEDEDSQYDYLEKLAMQAAEDDFALPKKAHCGAALYFLLAYSIPHSCKTRILTFL